MVCDVVVLGLYELYVLVSISAFIRVIISLGVGYMFVEGNGRGKWERLRALYGFSRSLVLKRVGVDGKIREGFRGAELRM